MTDKEIIDKIVWYAESGSKWELQKFLKGLNPSDLERVKTKCYRVGLCKSKDTESFIKEICNHIESDEKATIRKSKMVNVKNVFMYLKDVQKTYRQNALTSYVISSCNLDKTHSGTLEEILKLTVQGKVLTVRDKKAHVKPVNNIRLIKHNGICAVSYKGNIYYKNNGRTVQIQNGMAYANDFFTSKELYFLMIQLLYQSFNKEEKEEFLNGVKKDSNLLPSYPVEDTDSYDTVLQDGKNTIVAYTRGMTDYFTSDDFIRCKDRLQSIALHLKKDASELDKMILIMPPLENLKPKCEDDFQYYYE